MELNIKNKRALVTGGGHGIGLAIKKSLELEGVEVISWSKEEGFDLMKNIPELPQIDILINNVGGMGTSTFEDREDCMQKNYGIMTNLIDQFIKQTHINDGKVITISSFYGKEKGPCPWFTASKAAQIAYMKCMSNKFSNITFNTICPGIINTKEQNKQYAKEYNLYCGEPEDIANIVTFLCSDKARHINGACIVVDGGDSHSF